MAKRPSALVMSFVLGVPAAAQDLPTDQLERHGEVVMHGVLLNKTIALR